MDFFAPTGGRLASPTPEWLAPPTDLVGSTVRLQCVLARTRSVVVALSEVVAYPQGCLLRFRLATNGQHMSAAEWQHMHAVFADEHAVNLTQFTDGSTRSEFPEGGDNRLAEDFRCGIQLPDGTKATSLELPPLWDPTAPATPEKPVLVEHRSLGTHIENDWIWSGPEYWLWPLPPPEPLRLIVDWQAAGVGLTETELDGSAITRAGQDALRLFPG